ncbi:major coat protein [Candidatus Pantoea formicae]|uniref:major coat protein n=1 Tax=Candidatus Pantoea formicae TaxID=2608355 RepID=UPI003ED92F5C
MRVLSTVLAAKNKIALGAATMMVSVASFAADETATTSTDYATQAMDSLKTQATDLIAQVWPIVTTIVIAGLAIRIFKKFSSKAV